MKKYISPSILIVNVKLETAPLCTSGILDDSAHDEYSEKPSLGRTRYSIYDDEDDYNF